MLIIDELALTRTDCLGVRAPVRITCFHAMSP